MFSLLFLCWYVALFAVGASAKAKPLNATPVDLIMGKYGRTLENVASQPGGDVCSPSIEHKGTPNTNSAGDLFLQRSNIFHSGQGCGSEAMLLKYKPAKNIVSDVGKATEVYKKLKGTAQYFWVGKEARTCGVGSNKWVLPNPTAMFLTYDTKKDMMGPFGITLAKGIRYLIITNSKYTCVYRGVPKKTVVDPTAPPSVGNFPDNSTVVDDTGSPESVCFPGTSMVQVEGGEVKRMDSVAVGDRVHVGDGTYSEVFFFTHKQKLGRNEFIELHTTTRESISLTPGHYLYVNGRLTAARMVKVGDALRKGDGDIVTVERVERNLREGLYNPQTIQGDIVVDGIVASTFTTAVEPGLAVAALAPLRSLYSQLGIYIEGLLDNGSERIVRYIPKGNFAYGKS